MGPVRRTAVAVTASIAATLASRRVARYLSDRRTAIDAVAPDLRSPLLYLPLTIASPRVATVLQAMKVPLSGVAPGVEVTTETTTSRDGATVRMLRHDAISTATVDAPPRPALVWIHGGGLVFGAPEQCAPLASRWADTLDMTVLTPAYRLSPAHRFPAALEDCYAALCWLHDNAARLGVDPERIAVGGESAGGGLAAAVAQLARDRGGPAVCFQLLQYPMLDDRTVLRTDHAGTGEFVWNPTSNRFGWTSYLGAPPVMDDAPAHAAPARTEDLSGLPPAWIGVGDLDLFLEEDLDYARRLEDSGVAVEVEVVPGMYHAAERLVPRAPTAKAFVESMTAALAAGTGGIGRRAP